MLPPPRRSTLFPYTTLFRSGSDRARLARAKANAMSNTDLNRYRGLSRKLGSTPEQMRAAYQAALMANPDLTYGQFVAANVVSRSEEHTSELQSHSDLVCRLL